jgi:hypothetical protein
MNKPNYWTAAITASLLLASPVLAQVERIWLTHRTSDPSRIVVNWTTKTPGDSKVRFGPSKEYGQQAHVPGNRTLHHVEIPLANKDAEVHYSVSSGEQVSPDATFRTYPTDVLRVAVVANWQGKPNLQSLMKDKIHLLLTAGDNIPDLWSKCGVGTKDCTKPYEALIDAYPDLFKSIPFMPALGNHDREIRPRGTKPPADPVYDIDATAFCKFFDLPGDKWKWHFDLPDFQVRFIALDLNHIQDRGTTWQTCHDYSKDSVQFRWYEKLMQKRPPGFVVTLHNERNATMRGQEKGAWHEMFRQGELVVSGFGYYAERAEVDGLTYLNTSLGKGTKYADPKAKFIESEASYVLMTFEKGKATMTVELKSLDGKVLDRTAISMRQGGQ